MRMKEHVLRWNIWLRTVELQSKILAKVMLKEKLLKFFGNHDLISQQFKRPSICQIFLIRTLRRNMLICWNVV